jgi:hypothetical protein
MDNNNPTPGLDTPATRTLVGLLIGVVLTAGAFIGGFLVLDRNTQSEVVVSTAAPETADQAKLKLWHLDAGRIIKPVVNSLTGVKPGAEREVCIAIDNERVAALQGIPAAPNETIDRMYRSWITDLQAFRAVCGKKASVQDLLGQMQTASESFAAFYTAVQTVTGADSNVVPGAVARGPAPAAPGEMVSPTAPVDPTLPSGK